MFRSASFLFLLCFTCLLLSCNRSRRIPENFDYGSIKGNQYHNDFFGLDLTFDTAWAVQSKEEMRNIMNKGADLIAGSDEKMKKDLKASEVTTATLFGMFKYKVGTPVLFNPSMIMMAENLANAPGINSGSDYIVQMKKNLKQSAVKYDMSKPARTHMIGNKKFDVQEMTMHYAGLDITQEFYAAIINGFALTMVVSYNSDDDRQELYHILNNIKI